MFGNRNSRKHKAERLAGQAWDNLSVAVESAGSTTRSAGRRAAHLYDDASDRVGSRAREARRRANAAYDALTGKKPRTPWGLLAIVAAIGAAIGWVATTVGRQLPTSARKRAELESGFGPQRYTDDRLAEDRLAEDRLAEDRFPEDVSSELLSRP